MEINIKDIKTEELDMTVKDYVLSKQVLPSKQELLEQKQFINKILSEKKSFSFYDIYFGNRFIGNPILYQNSNTIQFEVYSIKNTTPTSGETIKSISKLFTSYSVNFIKSYCKEIPNEQFKELESLYNNSIPQIIQPLSELSSKYEHLEVYPPVIFDTHYYYYDSIMTDLVDERKTLREIVNETTNKLLKLKETNSQLLNKWFFYKQNASFIKLYSLDEIGNHYINSFFIAEDNMVSSISNVYITASKSLDLTPLNPKDEEQVNNLYNQFNNLIK